MTRPVEYPLDRKYIGFAVKLFHRASAKAQRTPSSEKVAKLFSLRAWRLGVKNFLKVVLFNILSVRI